jgi:hypothetical protein
MHTWASLKPWGERGEVEIILWAENCFIIF